MNKSLNAVKIIGSSTSCDDYHSFNMKIFGSRDEALQYGRKNQWLTVFYGNLVLDAQSFVDDHPGGAYSFTSREGKDIKDSYHNPEGHQHEALSLYTVGAMVKGSIGEPTQFLPPTWYTSKEALVPQIMRMKHQRYVKACDQPFHLGSPRMFEHPFFEFCSHNKWYTIVVAHLLLQAYILSIFPGSIGLREVLIYLCSIPLWTVMEYSIHRYIFHAEAYLPDGPYWRLVHFSLHGIHHMLPMDPDRLVFPPVLGVILFSILYNIMAFYGDTLKLVFLGIHIGYLMYDVTHYFLHHTKGGFLHWLKRYHAKHHYSGLPLGYGVSNPFWDIFMGTKLPI